MEISDKLVRELLEESGAATSKQIDAIRDSDHSNKKSLQQLVIKNDLVKEKELTKLYAQKIDVPFVELNPKEIPKEVLNSLPERIAKQYSSVVFGIEEDGTKLVAMADPDDIQAISFLQKQLGMQIRTSIATNQNIQAALDQYRGAMNSELSKVITQEDTDATDEEVDAADLAEDSPTAKTVNLLIEYAIHAGASDIHIEPREDNVIIRYRIDGILREANKLPKKIHSALVSRIKILSNLKIDERRAPQDGRFKIELGGGTYALRVSTLPITEGEKIVMRILNESSKAATLEELGYWGISLEVVNEAIKQPHGMILVTGPTGSGKSTSLFSILSLLNKPSINISTVEDPVEYKITGANQVQLNPMAGMTFASGLRALMRQDPNVIMVGEIRDSETANIGVQAALTGHLVFATLHTNNAATCLPRLLDMNVEPFLIASTVRAVVGQRLVRRLCVDCRVSFKPDKTTLKQISDIFDTDKPAMVKYIHNLEQQALDGGIGKSNSKNSDKSTDTLSTTPTSITTLYKAPENGCNSCGHTGYKGRLGIYEVLQNSEEIQRLLISGSTSEEIQQAAIKNGLVTMQIDGFIKALRGQTSIEEILRVTSVEH
ncbi:type II/IV secretion system protein [Candidatus Saccharibacteria bacterium]|nr:type II/IV secretion system protein [Candidatus Saccharibacteria bacterium]